MHYCTAFISFRVKKKTSIMIMNNRNSLSSTRQLLSWYTMAHNPNMPRVEVPGPLHPLWVRCDKSDPCATAWLGVETIYSGNKTSGVKLYTVCCKGYSNHVLHYGSNPLRLFIVNRNNLVLFSHFLQVQQEMKPLSPHWMSLNKSIRIDTILLQ